MTRFGLDLFIESFPEKIKGKKIGYVCHAASIASSYAHGIELLAKSPHCELAAIFGPQHGLFGQTQDNMIEWEGTMHPLLKIPVYSLYGERRKPSPQMLINIDALIFDLQDVGARPYTYVWTLKNCMDACLEAGIPLWVLDRPNPIGVVPLDGPMLSPDYFSFVGGAEIPLCHRMTMGEMALFLQETYFKKLDCNIVWMNSWWRKSTWLQTGLPWVHPSPNMPTLETAIVYPGMVLLEATNVSEGRGTTRPFELFGAPYIDIERFRKKLFEFELPGCTFREHGFIPSFQKWQGVFCSGMQIHVTAPENYYPVITTAAILNAISQTSNGFLFKEPPYEYETIKMPFDILSGDSTLRSIITDTLSPWALYEKWQESYTPFLTMFNLIKYYPEELH